MKAILRIIIMFAHRATHLNCFFYKSIIKEEKPVSGDNASASANETKTRQMQRKCKSSRMSAEISPQCFSCFLFSHRQHGGEAYSISHINECPPSYTEMPRERERRNMGNGKWRQEKWSQIKIKESMCDSEDFQLKYLANTFPGQQTCSVKTFQSSIGRRQWDLTLNRRRKFFVLIAHMCAHVTCITVIQRKNLQWKLWKRGQQLL